VVGFAADPDRPFRVKYTGKKMAANTTTTTATIPMMDAVLREPGLENAYFSPIAAG